MKRIYGEDDISWSCIEKDIPYAKVEWYWHKNGISTYAFFDENGKRIKVKLTN